jgi:CubicO group peptidase (beta-lactamase class C family)
MTKELHDAMKARVDSGGIRGMVTVLAQGDRVEVDEIGLPRNALFRITSMTKPVLATATMMLVEDGTLDLHEPVQKWLPELADRRVLARIDGPLDETVPAHRPITLDDLLTFRMGFGLITEPSFNPPYPINIATDELRLTMGPPDPRTPHHPDEWIRLFATLPLMDQPGERWRYNAGALVLGVLLARAAKAPLNDVLHERIFEPLGMTETGFSTSAANLDRIPDQYMTDFATGEFGKVETSPRKQWTAVPVFPSGADGLLSTADDYLAFARLLLHQGVHNGQRLLSQESVTLLTTNHLTPAQLETAGMLLQPRGWGYGMAVDSAGRYGWDGGGGTAWFNDPNHDLIAIALSQTSDFLFNGAREEFGRLAVQSAAV